MVFLIQMPLIVQFQKGRVIRNVLKVLQGQKLIWNKEGSFSSKICFFDFSLRKYVLSPYALIETQAYYLKNTPLPLIQQITVR